MSIDPHLDVHVSGKNKDGEISNFHMNSKLTSFFKKKKGGHFTFLLNIFNIHQNRDQ